MDATYQVCKIENKIIVGSADGYKLNVTISPYSQNPCSELLCGEDYEVIYKQFEQEIAEFIEAIKKSKNYLFASKSCAYREGFHSQTYTEHVGMQRVDVFDYSQYFNREDYINKNFFIVHSVTLACSLNIKDKDSSTFRLELEKVSKAYIPIDTIMRNYYLNQIIAEL